MHGAAPSQAQRPVHRADQLNQTSSTDGPSSASLPQQFHGCGSARYANTPRRIARAVDGEEGRLAMRPEDREDRYCSAIPSIRPTAPPKKVIARNSDVSPAPDIHRIEDPHDQE